MRLKLFTSWIFRGWIVGLLLILYAKIADFKTLCNDKQYLKGSTCCKKCEPGFHVFTDCTDTKQTTCRPCSDNEYQPGWTSEKKCIEHDFCDQGKGFMERPVNHVAKEPCPCRPNFKCSPINCEYCEKIPPCDPGKERESPNGKCAECKKGFFSNEVSADPCKQWTNCKAQGRTEIHPGSAEVDVVCGPPVSGAAPSWVIVSVMSVITVLCLVILLLFCYKDKMKLLSVNLRSCVQNLKRTRIQQETLAPLYHSGVTGGILGGSKCTPCETTKLVCQVPLTPTNELLCPFPTSSQDIKISLPFSIQMTAKEGTKDRAVSEDLSERSGEPEEVSEDEEPVNALAASCVCVVPVQEPLEVGENEDCSQAVNPGTLGTCSCGGSDGEEIKKEKTSETEKETDSTLFRHETGVSSLVSFSPSVPFSGVYPSNPLPELCLPLSQAETKLDFKPQTDKSLEEQYKLKCTDSTFIDSNVPSVTSAVISVSPLMTSSFVGELYQDKPPEYSSQGMSCEENRATKLLSEDSELACTPESLQSQLVEPSLTSGQVSGNHNTTFISSGQVMNFSGDVIVVYVSQTSLGNDGVEADNAFGSPVQEQADETTLFFQSSSTEDSITHSTLMGQTLPIQEMMDA